MKRFFRRLLSFVTLHRDDRELGREIDTHVALLQDEYRRRGMSPDEAALAARRAIGSVALARDRHRDARSFAWIGDALQDLRFALRMLRHNRGFAATAILTMALSIGATTTLFSLAYGVLMRPLPWPEAGRLIRLEETRGGRLSRIRWTVSNAAYLAWRDQPSTIEDVGGWVRSVRRTMVTDRDSDRVTLSPVTPSLFRLLRAQPALGRSFLDSDTGPVRAMILSYGLWQRRFGGRADVIGTSARIDGQQYTIVGVMPRGFSFPDPEAEVWSALGVLPVNGEANTIRLMMFSAMARLKPGVTVDQAAAEATARTRTAPDLKETAVALFGTNGIAGMTAAPALEVMTADVRPALMLLLAAVGLLFVASTASLIVLQLSRVARRRREIAVRMAIGAGAARLVRQWLVESAMLGALGAAAGLLAAMFLHRALPAALPAGFPRVAEVQLDWRVVAFACVVACLVSLACGMVPAFRGRRDQVVGALSEGASTTHPVTMTTAARVRTLLMAAQIAVACMLLVGASLLLRSFVALLAADRGFDPRGVLTMQIPLPVKFTFAEHRDMLDRLQQRLRTLPGVTDVALGNALPFATVGAYRGVNLALPRDPARKVEVQLMQRSVTPEYFRAMGLRLLHGRALAPSDTATAPPVMVVNRTFAAKYLGDHPLGQRLELMNNSKVPWEVVGVVEDMRQGANGNTPASAFGGVLDPPLGEAFFPLTQWPYPLQDLIVVMRTTTEPAALAAGARALVREADSSLVIDSTMTMEERVAGSLSGPRTYAVFLVGFALCALTIAGVGLFGVLSYTTVQRTREIGLRTALGAQRGDVMTLVGRQAMTITIGGLAAGLIASFFLSRTLTTLLYGISTRDVISFAIVPAVLLLVSLIACAVPALRASRISPIDALRAS
ncbi:MAG TPA: ABC transporter permease [Vicinamibacterales bacterium]|jgi:predicted permease